MQAPVHCDDDDELDWQIDDEVTFGPDRRRGVIMALSAHSHLKHQTVRVRALDGWGAECEMSVTDPTLVRVEFYMPTPATLPVTPATVPIDRNFRRTLLEEEAAEDKEHQEKKYKKQRVITTEEDVEVVEPARTAEAEEVV